MPVNRRGRSRRLVPLRILGRASTVLPDRVAVIDGARRITYREFAFETTRLANAIVASGVEHGPAWLTCARTPRSCSHHASSDTSSSMIWADG
jgi:non-ribosomal peptide synthetase component F